MFLLLDRNVSATREFIVKNRMSKKNKPSWAFKEITKPYQPKFFLLYERLLMKLQLTPPKIAGMRYKSGFTSAT